MGKRPDNAGRSVTIAALGDYEEHFEVTLKEPRRLGPLSLGTRRRTYDVWGGDRAVDVARTLLDTGAPPAEPERCVEFPA